MKSKNFLSKLWSSVADSQRNDVEFDRRLTVGSPSGFTMNWTLKLVSVLAILLTVGVGNAWGATTTLAGWTFTSGTIGTNYPNNKSNFTATTGTMTSSSTFYLNGSGSTWNSTKPSYAFTAVTDITITLTLNQAVPKGTVFTLSAATFYNKASNAPMTGFTITAKEGTGSFGTTGVGTTSWSLSTSSATKTTTYTTQAALASGTAIAFMLTGTGKAGSGQGYMNNITITATTYSVTYNGNSNSGGSVPTDNVKYITGGTVTVKANSGSLVRTNFNFDGWNTNSSGTGTNYAAGSGTFTITADKTLYAKWVAAGGCSTDPGVGGSSNGSVNVSGATVTCASVTKGDCDIDEWGFVYGTTTLPTGNVTKKGENSSTNVSSYNHTLTGLNPGTKYYVRGYAKVGANTYYGSETNFTTKTITAATNDADHCSVSIDGKVITADVDDGYQYDSPAYTVSGGSAGSTTTVSQDGDDFTVTSNSTSNITVTINIEEVPTDYFIDAMHSTTGYTGVGMAKVGDYSASIPTISDKSKNTDGTCQQKHYHFAGWVTAANKEDLEGNIETLDGHASGTTYYAVWEKEKAGSADGYLLVEDDDDLSAGDKILIASAKENSASVLGYQKSGQKGQTNRGYASSVSITSKVMNPTIASSNSETSYAFEIELQGTSSGWYLYDAVNSGYLQANGGTTDNYLTYHTGDSHDSHDTWTIAVADGTSVATIQTLAGITSSNKGWMRWNGSNSLFSCYNSGQSDVYVFRYAKEYEDPKVECICSENPSAGTAAVDATGTFSTSRIDVKATSASAGTDCSYTDYGFVWSSSVSAAADLKLVEATGAAATNCTRIRVGTSGEVTSFTGSLTGSFSAGNAVYFRSYVKNGKADGTYQYSSVVTITPRSVTFNLNGHGSSTPAAQLVNNGGKASDPSYSESVTGYIFGGWYKEAGCTNAWNFASDVASGENKTLYAKWTPITYSVRFNDNDENYLGTATGSMSNESFTYDESKALTANAFSLAGYDFAGWALTANGDVAYADKATISSNLSSTNGATVDLYAKWTAKKFDVTLAATNETSSVGSQTVQATYNAAMPTTKKGGGAVAAPTRTGYTFTGWEYSSTTYYTYNAGTSTLSSAHVWDQPNSTTTLTPQWSVNSYTLTWDLDGGTVATAGTGASAGATGTPSSSVNYGAAITAPTVTRSGYNFAGWDVTPASTMPASNTTYTATWTAKTLTSISLAETAVAIYDQQYVLINVTYDPADILTKGYTLVSSPAKVVTTGSTNAQLKLSATKGGVVISEQVSEDVSIKANADNTKRATVTVTINPLPRAHFVDLIHNESFPDVVATISDNALAPNKTTPTHADVAAGSGNGCETTHLHLVGWIRSDYSKVTDYMDGTTNTAPTVSELTNAGTGYWFTPGASINVDTYKDKTFYAVWAVEE